MSLLLPDSSSTAWANSFDVWACLTQVATLSVTGTLLGVLVGSGSRESFCAGDASHDHTRTGATAPLRLGMVTATRAPMGRRPAQCAIERRSGGVVTAYPSRGAEMSDQEEANNAAELEDLKRRVEELEGRMPNAPLAQSESDKLRKVQTLTRKERQVYEHLRAGYANKEIASALGISERVARFHVSNILNKLGLSRRVQILADDWPACQ